jgi:hypothetical protein
MSAQVIDFHNRYPARQYVPLHEYAKHTTAERVRIVYRYRPSLFDFMVGMCVGACAACVIMALK